jgi:molybdopterin/thiamine biosynthesis adenylyltransferase
MLRPGEEDRFDRSRRTGWIDMDALRRARVLVAGAGALGNEAVKCLLLSGVGRIDLVDMDFVSGSNLNRCLFFRKEDADERRPKAEVLAERAAALYPDAVIRPIVGRVQSLDPAAIGGYAIALGCLDNIAARLHLNAHAYHAGIPYVDAGTDGMRGKVQVVLPPATPCLQCLANSSHFRMLDKRQSCSGETAGLYRRPMAAEVTTTSVVAAIQAREALKILCGQEELCLRHVLMYDGMSGTAEVLEAQVDERCDLHGRRSLRAAVGENIPGTMER